MSKNGLALHADDLRAMGEDVAVLIKELQPSKAAELRYTWAFWARPNQLPPTKGNNGKKWNNWLILAGRGFGKTRSGAEWVREQVKLGAMRIACIAPTNSDIKRVMVEGESGFLNICWELDKTYKGVELGKPVWSPTNRTLIWANGARVEFYSAEEPERLRGPQFEAAWCDEICAWARQRETWDMLQFTLRLGSHPRVCITTTPKADKLIREILANPTTAVTYGSTFDNTANLAETYIAAVSAQYEGTRLGRQELYAEILDEAAGALWSREVLEKAEVDIPDPVDFANQLSRVVVSIDPAVTANAESDMTGLIVAGVDTNGTAYVLEDATDRYTPQGWAAKAIELYHRYSADRIVAEVNQGGDMVRHTLHTEDDSIPYRAVRASRGKFARAEPVSALYEREKVKHRRGLDELENQMVQWEPLGSIGSPDRLDACLDGSTPVLTEVGYKPISDVAVGEKVWTREGLKEVEWAGLTRRSVQTLDIRLSNGYIIKATPEHPFYVDGKGWVPSGDLIAGDLLITERQVLQCSKPQSKSPFLVKPTSATQKTLTSPSNVTTSGQVAEDSQLCTGMFGSTIMGLFLKASTFTTKMGISLITPLRTLSAYLQKNTQSGTGRNSTKFESRRWTMLGLTRVLGMTLRRVWPFTRNSAKLLGKAGSRSTVELVSAAASTFCRLRQNLGSVVESVYRKASGLQRSILKKLPAQSVVAPTLDESTDLVQRHVPVSVVAVSESLETRDVYNLHVKDCHEFVASGVLVHNCVWAITDLCLGGQTKPELNIAYKSKGLLLG